MKFLTKEQCFIPFENEKNIPIDKSKYAFKFSRRWFQQRNQHTFSTFLTKKFSNENPVKMIQIGVFEGTDLVWMFQNILGHPDSQAIAIDPWAASRKISQEEKCCKRARYNLETWKNKIQVYREFSQKILPQLVEDGKIDYDLVIIDGDHNAPIVYNDAMLSYQLLRVGGWMVFDDYHNRVTKAHHVQEGVDEFLQDYGDDVKLVWQHKHCVCFEKVK